MSLTLVVLSGSARGTRVPFEATRVMLVGSSPKAHIRLRDEGVAEQHAQIFLHGGGPAIIDLSGEQFLHNGEPKRQARLHPGDELGFGSARVRLEQEGDVEASSPPPRAGIRITSGPRQGVTAAVGRELTLGRAETSDVSIPDIRCSRNHCSIRWSGEAFVVIDDSSNGTWLNDARLQRRVPTLLRSGDRLRVGTTHIEFRAVGQADSAQVGAPSAEPAVAPAPQPPSGSAFEFEFDLTGGAGVDAGAQTLTVEEGRQPVCRPDAPTERLPLPGRGSEQGSGAALAGDLERMTFPQVAQFLCMAQLTGELIIRTPEEELGVSFRGGEICDAWGAPRATGPEECFQFIATVKEGQFTFHQDRPPREGGVTGSTMELLREAMRRAD